jgi:hypothetical protein
MVEYFLFIIHNHEPTESYFGPRKFQYFSSDLYMHIGEINFVIL